MNFDGLSDDQLVALIRAACAEAVRRGEAVKAAAENAALSEAEKAQAARDAARSETERLRRKETERLAAVAAQKVRSATEADALKAEGEKQQKLWGKRKGLAQIVVAVLGDGWSLKVWKRENEQRVYLDGPEGQKAEFFSRLWI